ncbi:hypothetical protein [Arthrobacter sp. NEB 688]|uniref:hypothetical protein n=1 Tax=Arthrobacter sp. NEB 688 TaxID=904039 RepID=UPI001567302E|nr:hypothetical protein [Arthrobacter sp. NEB 688]QKE84404.1 hypothetical protein HL663_10965 [Arthrobacter sp. NEB 688]
MNGYDRGQHLPTVSMVHTASSLFEHHPPGPQPAHTRHDEEMLVTHRDDVRLAEAWHRRGATNEEMIRDAVELGLEPDVVTGDLDDAAAFIGAAALHDLGDLAAVYLEQADGDPGEAWELWAADGDDE